MGSNERSESPPEMGLIMGCSQMVPLGESANTCEINPRLASFGR
jgi:hypothetical protein